MCEYLLEIYKKIDILFYIFYNIITIMQISTMNMPEMPIKKSRNKTVRNMNRQMKRRSEYITNDFNDESLMLEIPPPARTNFRECVETFKKSREYAKVESYAKTLAFKTLEQPEWIGLDTITLKAIFILLLERNNDVLLKPLRNYTRHQLISQNTRMWKEPENSLVDTLCMICYETIKHDTPTITLLCNHSLCTSCFLKCCKHSGNQVLESCPMCRAVVRMY